MGISNFNWFFWIKTLNFFQKSIRLHVFLCGGSISTRIYFCITERVCSLSSMREHSWETQFFIHSLCIRLRAVGWRFSLPLILGIFFCKYLFFRNKIFFELSNSNLNIFQIIVYLFRCPFSIYSKTAFKISLVSWLLIFISFFKLMTKNNIS